MRNFIAAVVLAGVACAGLRFWYVRGYLKDEAAYEDLRSGKRPSLVRFFEWFLRFPCSAVVL